VRGDAGSASADAGHLSDLKPERSARQDQNRDAAARRREWRKHGLTKSPVISIAKIRGRVRGVSSEFALACDMRFASRENTLLGQPLCQSHRSWLDCELLRIVSLEAAVYPNILFGSA
jgi:enoyl-CoA hydratase/carnithine racemase